MYVKFTPIVSKAKQRTSNPSFPVRIGVGVPNKIFKQD